MTHTSGPYNYCGVAAKESTTNAYANLYNGNISSMITALHDPDEDAMTIHGNAYRYDQLNRIRNSYTYANVSGSTDLVQQNNTFTGATDIGDYNTTYQFDKNGNLAYLTRKAHDIGGTNTMDDFTYFYYKKNGGVAEMSMISIDEKTNRLAYVDDAGDNSNDTSHDLGDILDGQSTSNYKYNKIGQLEEDDQENIREIRWNAAGKVTEIIKTDATPDLEFIYGPLGNRIAKIKKPKDGTGTSLGESAWEYTVYSLDASGNPMSIYELNYEELTTTTFKEHYVLKEQHIYGSSRVGLRNLGVTIATNEFTDTGYPTASTFTSNKSITASSGASDDDVYKDSRKMELKVYEMANHLGNVLIVVTDRKLPTDDELHYTANIISTSDYYPYGMQKKARCLTEAAFSDSYRYGFQGQEKDDEVKSSGNSINYTFRMHDPRLGRFFAVDPLESFYPQWSPYTFSGNQVIHKVELEGLEPGPGSGSGARPRTTPRTRNRSPHRPNPTGARL